MNSIYSDCENICFVLIYLKLTRFIYYLPKINGVFKLLSNALTSAPFSRQYITSVKLLLVTAINKLY